MRTHASVPPPADAPALEALLIRLEPEIYAVPSPGVREVTRHRSITPVPGAPQALPGIISQRGTILPVIDLRLVLGMAAAAVTRATRLVVVAHEEVELALLVDAVLDLATLAGEFAPVPPTLDPARARFLRGVARYDERPVILLEVGEVVAALRGWS